MKSPLRIAIAAGPMVSLGLCLATLLLWLRSYEAYPAVALASGGRTWHGGAHRGELWLTCASGWPTPEDASRAARTAPAARPLVVVAAARVEQFERMRGYLLNHAALLRRHLGDGDSQAAAEERLARTLQLRLRDELTRQAGGAPAEPVIADGPPEERAAWGFRSERAWARFPLRGDDGEVGYAPRVALAAIAIPCWVPAAVFAAWPLWAIAGELWRRIRARRRLHAGRCRACGYDLRATGDADGPRLGRCPECGTPAAAAVAAVMLFLPLATWHAAADAGPTTAPARLPDDPAARALVLANERSRDRLPAFEAGLAVAVNESTRATDADYFDIVYRAKGTARYLDGNPETGPFGGRTRVVLNEAYVAAWGEHTGGAYQNEYDDRGPPSIDPDDNGIAAHIGRALLRYDPLVFAYGDGHSPIRQALASRWVTRYSVEDATDATGRRVARLNVYTRQIPGPNYPAYAYEFDPQRGHAITRVTCYRDGGEPREEHVIELQPAGDGWVPKRVRTISHDYNVSTPRTALDMAIRLSAVGDQPDTAFRLDALELPESAIVFRRSPSGSTQGLVRHDGVWVPMSPAWLPMRRRGPTTLPVNAALPKWTWPAAGIAAGALWVVGIVLMRRRFAGR